jgi:alkanesulfonate monooxygenase SsuD/methylene tetrahydromethanopterin reductase-like flavin-dependent oxidoreductase (luciferase family)
VVLAAAAARTTAIRLACATTLLGIADPVRVYEDFATVDLISRGRVEIIAGRSAFAEPLRLFGYDTADYDALFADKLGLLLNIRSSETVTWHGRFRPALDDAFVTPRAAQDSLPVWVGVGGSADSAERAGRLGLPMILGYIGGALAHVKPLADAYRAAGERAGHVDSLKLALSTHSHAGADAASARATYPYYYESATQDTGRPGLHRQPGRVRGRHRARRRDHDRIRRRGHREADHRQEDPRPRPDLRPGRLGRPARCAGGRLDRPVRQPDRPRAADRVRVRDALDPAAA